MLNRDWRLDRELVMRGLARSIHAQAMINAGQVTVDGSVVKRPGEQVASSAAIHTPDDRYVSRGAHKLIGALDDLQLAWLDEPSTRQLRQKASPRCCWRAAVGR